MDFLRGWISLFGFGKKDQSRDQKFQIQEQIRQLEIYIGYLESFWESGGNTETYMVTNIIPDLQRFLEENDFKISEEIFRDRMTNTPQDVI